MSLKQKLIDFAVTHFLFVYKPISAFLKKFRALPTAYYNYKIAKRAKNEKIVVAFIVSMPEVWNSLKSVYESALKNEKIIPIIVAQQNLKSGKNPAYDYLSTQYPDVINANDSDWFDLKAAKPDYVFYTRTYIGEYYNAYSPKEVKKYAQVCIVPYGYPIMKTLGDIGFVGSFMIHASFVFFCTEEAMKNSSNKLPLRKHKHFGCMFFGCPRFDLPVSKSINNDKFTILWIPRYTKPDSDIGASGFLKYKDSFINYALNNSDVELIIRPHPLMFERYLNWGLLSEDDIQQFKNTVDNAPNIQLDYEKDYLKSMGKSNLMVADLSSLIVEYYLTEKPIIFCESNTDNFFEEAKTIANSLYPAKDFDDIKNIIKQIYNKNDYKKSERQEIINKIRSNDKPAGEKILDFIIKDYLEK